MPDKHMMIDLETLDTSITASIISIGAVVFDPRSDTFDDEFKVNISAESNKRYGRSVSERTMEWWSMQDSAAQMAAFGGPHVDFDQALRDFTVWINRQQPTCTRVWAKSPDFDCSILSHACQERGIIWPFKFWEARCVRTIMELAYPNGDFPFMTMDGPKHDSLADAKKQVLEVQHSFYVLRA